MWDKEHQENDRQENISCDKQSVIPFEQDNVTLPAWIANHKAVFG